MTVLDTVSVKLVGDWSDFEKSMTKAQQAMERAGRSMERVGKNLSVRVTAPLMAIGGAAFASAVKVGNFADQLLDLSQMTGLTTDELQRFRALATEAGVGADTIANAVQRMTVRMATGEEGSADLRNGMEQLGISMRDAAGNARPMGAVVEEALAKLSSMEDVTERNVTAVRLFGRSAAELAPVLGLTADEMGNAIARAEDLGLIMSNDALKAANAFRVEYDFMKQTVAAASREIGVAVIPIMRSLVNVFNTQVLPAVRSVIAAFAGLDPQLVMVGAAIAGVAAAIGPVLLVGGKLIGMLALVATPAGLVVAAMASLATIAMVVAKNWDVLSLQGTLAWTALKDVVLSAVSAILGALEGLPLVGQKFADLRAEVDELAERSLVGANEKIAELEARINANGAAAAAAAPQITSLRDVMDQLGEAGSTAAVNIGAMEAGLQEITVGTINPMTGALVTLEDRIQSSFQTSQVELWTEATAAAARVLQEIQTPMERYEARMRELDRLLQLGAINQQQYAMAAQLAASALNQQADAQDRLNSSLSKASGFLGGLGSLGRVFGMGIPGLGQASGLLSAFQGFRGFFAEGGTLGAGQWGIAGEAGPEIVRGPAQITPMSDSPVNVSIQLVTETGRAITDRITYTAGRDDRRGRVIRVPLNAAVVTP